MQNAVALGEGYCIDVRSTHDCYIKFDYVRFFLTSEKYWYEIRTNSSHAVRNLYQFCRA